MGEYTKKLERRVLNRGPKEGLCAICNKHDKLTKDHVPPQGCGNICDRELRLLFPDPENINEKTISQSGTYFSSICTTCNSERLGLQFDPELVKLYNEIINPVRSSYLGKISVPQEIFAFVKPQLLARSIIGHLLAARANGKHANQPSKMNNSLVEYFLDITKPFPEDYNLYYWIYPCRTQVVLKSFVRGDLNANHLLGHVIKFMPFAFYLIYNQPNNIRIDFPQLLNDKNMKLNEIRQLKFDLTKTVDIGFPEIVRNAGYTLSLNNLGYSASEKTNKM